MLDPTIYEFLKARGFPVGTVRTHGGKKVIKQADGKWKPVKGQGRVSKKTSKTVKKQAKAKNINKRNRKTGMTPLLEAIEDGRKISTIKKLIEQGANVNTGSRWGGGTPLIEAVEEKRPALIKLLLEHGAKINKPNAFGFTPLHWAVGKSNENMVRLLLKHGANPHIRDDEGRSVLRYAILEKHTNLAKLVARHIKKQKKTA